MSDNKNIYTHLTAKKREKPSWPTRKILAKGLIEGEVLDFGSGYGVDVEFLSEKGFSVTAYDPYAPEYPEKSSIQLPATMC